MLDKVLKRLTPEAKHYLAENLFKHTLESVESQRDIKNPNTKYESKGVSLNLKFNLKIPPKDLGSFTVAQTWVQEVLVLIKLLTIKDITTTEFVASRDALIARLEQIIKL